MIPRSLTLSMIVAALAAGAATTASADGLYLGADLGHPQYSNNVNGIGGGDDANNGGIGAKIYGGYSLTPNFALEGSLFRLGHSRVGDTSVNTSGVALDGVGTYSFAPQWSVLGRVGVAEGRFSTSFGNDSSPALKMGAGVQYDLTKQLALRVQYERYHFVNAFDGKPNIGEYTAGIKMSF
jgi:OOP family OmpA-OmpF porin